MHRTAEVAVCPRPPPRFKAETDGWTRSEAPHGAYAQVVEQVNADYALSDTDRRVLTAAAEAWDRMGQAREAPKQAGSLTYEDRLGAPRARPEVNMERDARISFVRCCRELALEDDDVPDVRPPRLRSA